MLLKYHDFVDMLSEEAYINESLEQLDESASTQKSIEWLQTYVIKLWTDQLFDLLKKGKSLTAKNIDSKKFEFLPSHAGKFTTAVKKTKRLDPDFREFLLGTTDGVPLTIKLYYETRRNHYGGFLQDKNIVRIAVHDDFILEFNRYMDSATPKRVFEQKFIDMVVNTTIAHEVQHAFDAYRSNNANDMKFTYQHASGNQTEMDMGKKQGWVDPGLRKHQMDLYNAKYGIDDEKQKALSNLDARGDEFDEYSAYTHEVNARYSEAINRTKIWVEGRALFDTKGKINLTAADWLTIFRDNFKNYSKVKQEHKKRLESRALAEYIELMKIYKSKFKKASIGNALARALEAQLLSAFDGKIPYAVKTPKVRYDKRDQLLRVEFTNVPSWVRNPQLSISFLDELHNWSVENGIIVSINFRVLDEYLNTAVVRATEDKTNTQQVGDWSPRGDTLQTNIKAGIRVAMK